MTKAENAFPGADAAYDTMIGRRSVHRLVNERYGLDSMPETAENVTVEFGDTRKTQEPHGVSRIHMALASRQKPWRHRGPVSFTSRSRR